MNHLLYGLAGNPSLPPDLLDRLISAADADLGEELAARGDLSPAQVAALAARGEDIAVRLVREGRLTADDVDPVTQPYAALALLDEGAGRPEWARLLAAHPAAERREKLASCAALPADVTETLAADPDVRVVAELALWTTPETAARLAGHPHAEVRRAVAANEAAPPAVLAMLITGEGMPPARRCLVCDRERTPFVHPRDCPRPDCDLPPDAACDGSHQSTVHGTLYAALRNPATPIDAAVRLAGHPSTVLRSALAARPDLPATVGARLAEDPLPAVRAELAANPGIDGTLARVLAVDQGHDVQRSLAHNPNVPIDVLTTLAGATRIGPTLLPRIAAATAAEVAELAASAHPVVRMLVAHRRDLPAEVRDALAADPDAKVVKSVAPHPGLSEGRLRDMVARHGARVAARVAANPDASPGLLEELTRHEPPVQKVFREVARHHDATVPALLACLTDSRARQVAAAHPALPPSVLTGLLADDDRQVAEAAAANPSLPAGVMADLLRDPHVPGPAPMAATPTRH
ncbi:hypothetical protein SAMN05216532_0735 [Streptomyces sp. 2231.1]|uniref:hypothetical protein n=1 Tax=Streptomyces sp. 2231.1 TaxID=1855347 RepID=UPI00089D734E|nr:hypothetical protein [Streptomyces sp. 2231.1]SEC19272.1 hypothetical protein SAMN05216532_0735 [Streptomyces sp. 2231.1]